MKKLLSLLAACTAIVCTFGSCGDKKEDDSVSQSDMTETTSGADSGAAETTASTPIFEDETHEYIKGADTTAFIGKWECSKLIANGEEFNEVNGVPSYAVFQYNILEDGSVTLPDSLMEIADPENPTTYKWGMISDTEIEITGSNGSALVYTLADGQLVNIDETEEIYLNRVDDFQYFDFKGYYDKLLAQQNQQYVLTPVVTDANGEVVGTGEPIPVE